MRLLPDSGLPQRFQDYLDKDEKLRQVVSAVKSDFDQSGLTAHNWAHIYRDALNAIVIGEAEGADMNIVLPAIVMHDIGFLYGGTGNTHGAVGADKLLEFLTKHGIEFNDPVQQLISDCIRTHKGSTQGEGPETLEAQVVADADLLEKAGPFGVYQTIRTFTEFDWPIEQLLSRIDSMKFELITETGKKLAEPGWPYVREFYRELAEAYKPYIPKD